MEFQERRSRAPSGPSEGLRAPKPRAGRKRAAACRPGKSPPVTAGDGALQKRSAAFAGDQGGGGVERAVERPRGLKPTHRAGSLKSRHRPSPSRPTAATSRHDIRIRNTAAPVALRWPHQEPRAAGSRPDIRIRNTVAPVALRWPHQEPRAAIRRRNHTELAAAPIFWHSS